ncbi:acyl-CoA reductase [Galbibacter sp.]|uniref:acyl-CoA reductase n=1 Tax=Galbibacter sp. TaxID=2918471 RepID=UPI002C042ADA|nr:acyl-CoA reductase [Galbibacter sp.]HLV62382.1 acyl-CoA reductase [Galbibacter sp.]
MGEIHNRIAAFVKLGNLFRQTVQENNAVNSNEQVYINALMDKLNLAEQHNAWFTRENLFLALSNWADALTLPNIEKWLSNYNFDKIQPKLVAVIMAGNIPLVGFHDFLCVLISGHKIAVRQSSNDMHLLPFVANYLEHLEPCFKGKISFYKEKLPPYDAVIATGSTNTARYFEYYFKNKPNIIRKNRNSVAILTGKESLEELYLLGKDIFTYYGLGCRSVSKLFVPQEYDFEAFFKAIYPYREIINENKYANNYDYNKAVYLMSLYEMLENGFLMLKEDTGYGSPIATLFYERYTDQDSLKQKLIADGDQLQCVVSKGWFDNEIPFGKTQEPELWDYADHVDTLNFLLAL